MNNESRKIKTFTDLNSWREGHKLVLQIYKATRFFPKEEHFGLASQIQRAAVSITSNIAEGFSRSSYKEKVQFYYIALGSVSEVQNQLLIAKDLNYFKNSDDFKIIAENSITLSKLINGLIKSSKGRTHDS